MTWQPPRVVFPDVELVMTGLLRDALDGRPEPYAADVYVGTTTPSPRRARMITIRRDGGASTDGLLEAAQIGVNVWADTEQDVNDLARLIRALLWAAPNGKPVCRVVDVSGSIAIADDSGQPLRYMTFEVVLRGEPLAL